MSLSCFPHILNLSVQDFVDALKYTPPGTGIDRALLQSLNSDVVARTRDMVVSARSSSLRREEWWKTITELLNAGEKVPKLALIYDVATRWSAMFNMIDRFLAMQVVSFDMT